MLLYEPPPTQGDIHVRLFGFPVRISPLFWLTAVLLGLNSGGPTPPLELATWVVVVLVSILVHELGHAFAQRHYGGRPRITLHAMGGLASCDDCDRRPLSQIVISLAGPAAGFVLALVVAAALRVAGVPLGMQFGDKFDFEQAGLASVVGLSLPMATIYWRPLATPAANHLVFDLMQVNILWGLVNLLPIYPLDGGRVAREICMLGHPRRGVILALRISMIAAGAMAALALFSWRSIFTAILFGYMAYANFRTLQAYEANRW